MVFPVVVYGCESWTIKKAEHWRIDAFKVWCWRRRLRVPWTASRPNYSILRDGQGGLACCSSWGCKELDTTERLNWTDYLCNLGYKNIRSRQLLYPLEKETIQMNWQGKETWVLCAQLVRNLRSLSLVVNSRSNKVYTNFLTRIPSPWWKGCLTLGCWGTPFSWEIYLLLSGGQKWRSECHSCWLCFKYL